MADQMLHKQNASIQIQTQQTLEETRQIQSPAYMHQQAPQQVQQDKIGELFANLQEGDMSALQEEAAPPIQSPEMDQMMASPTYRELSQVGSERRAKLMSREALAGPARKQYIKDYNNWRDNNGTV